MNTISSFFFTTSALPGPRLLRDVQHQHHHHHHHHFHPFLGLNNPVLFNHQAIDANVAFQRLLAQVQAQSEAAVEAPPVTTTKETLGKLPKLLLTPDRHDRKALMGLPVKELKNMLHCYNVSSLGMLEKDELVECVEKMAASASFEGKTCVPISKAFVSGADRTCTMCFDQFQAGDSVTRLPCGHIFHMGEQNAKLSEDECCPGVTKWLAEHANSCPNCKSVIPEGGEFPAFPAETKEDLAINKVEVQESGESKCTIHGEGERVQSGTATVFIKHQHVEYCNSDGAWEPAVVVDVGYDDEVEPFYTISLSSRGGQERGTVQSRLRSLSSSAGSTAGSAAGLAAAAMPPRVTQCTSDSAVHREGHGNGNWSFDGGSIGPSPLKRSRS